MIIQTVTTKEVRNEESETPGSSQAAFAKKA
jgi:hypothetical protein